MTDQDLILQFEVTANKYFRGLTFKENTHEYFVNGQKIAKSVSGLIKELEEHVDWDAKAKAKDIRLGMPIGTHKAMWKKKTDIACFDGTATHNFAETSRRKEEADTKKKQAVVKFWSDCFQHNPDRFVVVSRERIMYHTYYKYSGTGDVLLFDRLTNSYIIVDYKTNEDLFKNFRGKKLMKPFQDLLDNPYNHYQVQLTLYEVLIKQLNLYPVSEKWIVWLLPDGTYQRYVTHNITSRVEYWLGQRKAQHEQQRGNTKVSFS